jgi:hypothetical protein
MILLYSTHLNKYYYRYIEKQPGKFVGDTACEKLPVKGCRFATKKKETKLTLNVVFALKQIASLSQSQIVILDRIWKRPTRLILLSSPPPPFSYHTTFRTSLLVFLLPV